MPLWRSLSARRRALLGGIFVGTIMTLVMLFWIQGLPFFGRIELAAYDWEFGLRPDRALPANIVVVGVDHNSIENLSFGAYPIQRCWVGRAVNFLHKAGAAAIGIDFRYGNDSFYGHKDDVCLATAIKRAGNVVVSDILPGNIATNKLEVQCTIEEPIDIIRNAAAATGLANVPQDIDGSVRRADLIQYGPGGNGVCNKPLPAFPLQIASLALHKSPFRIVKDLGTSEIYVNYNGHQNPGDVSQQTFQIHSLENIASDDPTICCDSPKLFRNKIVVIIGADNLAGDIHTTAVGQMYGGFLQANTLNTILRRDAIQPAGDGANAAILLILGLLVTVVCSTFGIWKSTAATLLIAVGYVAVAIGLFWNERFWLNLVTVAAEVILVFAAVMALRFATEERLKRKTARQFGQYVTPEIVEVLINVPDAETALRGARRAITCLFVDIRGFTAMSEGMDPEQVVDALDVYLEELTRSVQDFYGTTDKYVGDELMAIWNAPRYQADHALLGVRCALDMVARTETINQQLTARGLPRVRYGIGVNTGEAVVGQMGSSLRKQYTVIGDTVNTGARLCSAAGGGEVIIGQGTWEIIGDRLEVQETESLRLKGKSSPLRTFIVLAIKDVPEGRADAVPSPAAS
jgi:adenylate cyclase